jgi:hypothetical protein
MFLTLSEGDWLVKEGKEFLFMMRMNLQNFEAKMPKKQSLNYLIKMCLEV